MLGTSSFAEPILVITDLLIWAKVHLNDLRMCGAQSDWSITVCGIKIHSGLFKHRDDQSYCKVLRHYTEFDDSSV